LLDWLFDGGSMSGGYFNYDQYKIGYIVHSIEQLVINNDSKELNEWGDAKGRGYSKDTIEAFEEAIFFLRTAQIYAHRIDWLVSGDDGEERFHIRLNKELEEEQHDKAET
jgi:hypothetical protein